MTVNPVKISKNRDDQRETFLVDNQAVLKPNGKLGNDASFRTYYRLATPENTLLMDSPAAHEPVAPFVDLANHLRSLNLNAPEIIAEDRENNFLIIEDFGNDTFSQLLGEGENPYKLYRLAVDTLIALHQNEKATDIEWASYTVEKLIDETTRTLNWYYPLKTGKNPNEAVRQEWMDAWKTVFDGLPDPDISLVLRDYHCDNLMYVENETGVKTCGLLDFQDGLIGPMAYDLVSILENDRLAVDEALQTDLLNHYFEKMDVNKENYLKWYRVLGAQRQSKILGLFYRLYIRDGKPGYLQFIPQVCRLLQKSFKDPLLAPVKTWFDHHIGELESINQEQIDLEKMQSLNLGENE